MAEEREEAVRSLCRDNKKLQADLAVLLGAVRLELGTQIAVQIAKDVAATVEGVKAEP